MDVVNCTDHQIKQRRADFLIVVCSSLPDQVQENQVGTGLRVTIE